MKGRRELLRALAGRNARIVAISSATLVLSAYAGLSLALPSPDVAPGASGSASPFAANFTIKNRSAVFPMREVSWYCTMIELGVEDQVPILDVSQYAIRRERLDIAPGGEKEVSCFAKPLEKEGTFDVSLKIVFQTVIEIASVKIAFKREWKDDSLTWKIDRDGGQWANE